MTSQHVSHKIYSILPLLRNIVQMLILTYMHVSSPSPIWMYACTPYRYEHLWQIEPSNFRIDEAIIYVSKLTETTFFPWTNITFFWNKSMKMLNHTKSRTSIRLYWVNHTEPNCLSALGSLLCLFSKTYILLLCSNIKICTWNEEINSKCLPLFRKNLTIWYSLF